MHASPATATRLETFPTTGAVAVHAETGSAAIRIEACDTDHAEVELRTVSTDGITALALAAATIAIDGRRLTIHMRDVAGAAAQPGAVEDLVDARTSRGRLVQAGGLAFRSTAGDPIEATIRIPHGSSLTARTVSGRIDTVGDLATVTAETTSGAIAIQSAANATALTHSGAIALGGAGAALTRTVTGATRIDETGYASCSSVSGAIAVRDAAGPVTAQSVSGAISIRYSGTALPSAHGMTGTVIIHAH